MKKYMILMSFMIFFTVSPFCFSQFGGSVNVALSGTTLEIASRLPASVKIEALDPSGKRLTTAKSNSKDATFFMAGLKAGQTLTIAVNDPKYLKTSFPFEIPNTNKYTEYSHDIMLFQKVKDNSVRMIVPVFEPGKSELRAGSDFLLDDYLDLFKKNTDVSFCIDVYPDNSSDKSQNKILTTARAEALKDYFVKNGINTAKISIMPYDVIDAKNPPPTRKVAKGKKYVGSVYLRLTDFIMEPSND